MRGGEKEGEGKRGKRGGGRHLACSDVLHRALMGIKGV